MQLVQDDKHTQLVPVAIFLTIFKLHMKFLYKIKVTILVLKKCSHRDPCHVDY